MQRSCSQFTVPGDGRGSVAISFLPEAAGVTRPFHFPLGWQGLHAHFISPRHDKWNSLGLVPCGKIKFWVSGRSKDGSEVGIKGWIKGLGPPFHPMLDKRARVRVKGSVQGWDQRLCPRLHQRLDERFGSNFGSTVGQGWGQRLSQGWGQRFGQRLHQQEGSKLG